MRHYVLTRSAFGPAWTREANLRRLAITRAVTARCMAAQTVPWTWVVLLDAADPLLAARMDLYGSSAPAFLPIVVERTVTPPSKAAAADYAAAWRASIPADDVVLTTRLDDDDGFAPDALARFQAAAGTERTALMLPVGIHLWRGNYAVVTHERNAMHTLVTPPGDTASVYDYGHMDVAERVPVVMVDREPGWLWVRHRDTISEARYPFHWGGRPARLTPAIRALFPIDWSAVC